MVLQDFLNSAAPKYRYTNNQAVGENGGIYI